VGHHRPDPCVRSHVSVLDLSPNQWGCEGVLGLCTNLPLDSATL
jgi:hypothetical protein